MEDLSHIGAYAVQRVIGEGGFGKVYQAYQPFLDRHVAIKMLRAEALGDVSVNGRFVHEARTIARLRHPNIVTVYEFGSMPGETDPMTYMVMEYLPGETLRTRLERGRSAPKEVVSIIEQLAQGLDYAHAQGVIHRDLTPSNVLFSAHGEPVIVDFGLAQLFEVTRGDQVVATRQTSVRGTPAYMAPEQVVNGNITKLTDQYALAIIAYEMLTNDIPFDGLSVHDLMMARLKDSPAPIAEKYNLPLAVDGVILRAMALDPTERYPNATAFARALGEALLPDEYRPKVIRDPLQTAELNAARQTIVGFMRGLAFAVLVVGLFCMSLILRNIIRADGNYLGWSGFDSVNAENAEDGFERVEWMWFDGAVVRAGLRVGDLVYTGSGDDRYVNTIAGLSPSEYGDTRHIGDIVQQTVMRDGEVFTISYPIELSSLWYFTFLLLAIPNATAYIGALWLLQRWEVRYPNRLMVPILLMTSLTIVSVHVNDQLPYLDSLVFYILSAMLLHFILIFPTRLAFVEKYPRVVWLAYIFVPFGLLQFMRGGYLDVFGLAANDIGYTGIGIALPLFAIGKWGFRDFRRYPALGWFGVCILAVTIGTFTSMWAYDWWNGQFSEVMSLVFIAASTMVAVWMGMYSFHRIMLGLEDDNPTLPERPAETIKITS